MQADWKYNWIMAWRTLRAIIGESVLTLGVLIMPLGRERKKLEECLYEYYLWSKDNLR